MLAKLKTLLKRNKTSKESENQPEDDVDEILQTKDIILALKHTTYQPHDYDPMPGILAVREELEVLLEATFAKADIDADNGDMFDEWLLERYGDISVIMNQEYLAHRQVLIALFQDFARQTSTAKYELLPLLEEEEEEYLKEEQLLKARIWEIEGRSHDV